MAAKRSGARSKRSQRISASLQPVQEPRSEPPLSRERIVATAVELLDAQGVDGLTMRRLADRLGSGVMSLYWHVDNKEDVFDLALDSVLEYRGPPQMVSLKTGAGKSFICSKTGAPACCAIPGRHRCCRAGRSARTSSVAWNC